MKYKAEVIDDGIGDDCPGKGYIRVICPNVFGFMSEAELGDLKDSIGESSLSTDEKDVRDQFVGSPWIEASIDSPMDFFNARVGDRVWIEETQEGWCWSGSYIGDDYIGYLIEEDMEAYNTQVVERTDRVYGSRWGSYLKIQDVEFGNMIIEAQGKFKGQEDRRGPRIKWVGSEDATGVMVSAGGHDPNSEDSENPDELMEIFVDATKDAEKIWLKDRKNKNYILEDKDGLIIVTGANSTLATVHINNKDGKIEILDQNSNKVTMDSSGIITEDKNSNKITLSSTGFKVEDGSGNNITSDATSVTINSNLQVLQ